MFDEIKWFCAFTSYNYYTKIYNKATFLVSELILTPLSPFDIKCKKFKRKKGCGEDGHMAPNTF